MLKETLLDIDSNVNKEDSFKHGPPKYIIYWKTSEPHCENHRQVKQTDGKIAYVCRHELEDKDEKS